MNVIIPVAVFVVGWVAMIFLAEFAVMWVVRKSRRFTVRSSIIPFDYESRRHS